MASEGQWPPQHVKPALRIASLEVELEIAKAENARLREALEPSGDTKAAYMGEFSFSITRWEPDPDDDEAEYIEATESVMIPWTTIKEIMKAISDRAALR